MKRQREAYSYAYRNGLPTPKMALPGPVRKLTIDDMFPLSPTGRPRKILTA